MMDMIDAATLIAWLNRAQEELERQKAYLTELDAPIGDSDHGINMARGFTAMRARLDAAASDTGSVLKTAAMTLISTVGGASGPLYGTLFLQAAGKANGKPALTLGEWTEALEAGLAGVMARGKAQPNDKTMVDALAPAVAALKAADGADLAAALLKAAEAAEAGMKATIPLIARKGRASYLGERSIGHQDPGATSAHLLLRSLAEICAA